jgi:hypothetical protein
MRHHPYSLPGPGEARRPRFKRGLFKSLGQTEGDGAPTGATFLRVHTFSSKVWRLSARHHGVFAAAGPRFRPASKEAEAVSELLAGGPSAPERCPGAARVRGARFPTPAGAAPTPLK